MGRSEGGEPSAAQEEQLPLKDPDNAEQGTEVQADLKSHPPLVLQAQEGLCEDQVTAGGDGKELSECLE